MTKEFRTNSSTRIFSYDWITGHSGILATFLCVALLSTLLASQIVYVVELENKLSGIADPVGEGRALRAGLSYAKCGFWVDYGLPNIEYGLPNLTYGGPTFPRWRNAGPSQPRVYTHYPPGSDMIAGVLTRLLGNQNLSLFRIVPLLTSMLAVVFLAHRLMQIFGNIRAVIILLCLSLAPMFSNMMHGLYYESYSLALLLVQLGILMDFLGADMHPSRLGCAALGLIGFLQGCFSFDYFFLVSFAAIPFWLLARLRGGCVRMGSLVACTVVPIFGFALAHALHLVQVALFYHSLERAVIDMSSASRFSRNGPFGDAPIGRIDLLYQYARILSKDSRYFSFAWSGIICILCFLFAFNRGGLLGLLTPRPWVAEWTFNRHSVIAVGAALIISALWIVISPFHGICHTHFLPRHFFLSYFIGIIVVLQSVSIRLGQQVVLLREEIGFTIEAAPSVKTRREDL